MNQVTRMHSTLILQHEFLETSEINKGVFPCLAPISDYPGFAQFPIPTGIVRKWGVPHVSGGFTNPNSKHNNYVHMYLDPRCLEKTLMDTNSTRTWQNMWWASVFTHQSPETDRFQTSILVVEVPYWISEARHLLAWIHFSANIILYLWWTVLKITPT